MSEVLDKFRPLYHPESIAVLGATNSHGKWGYIYSRNIVDGGFKGRIYPVHPKAPEVLGIPAFKNIKDVPGPVDLAVVLLRPDLVYQSIRDCVKKGVRAIVVITAGFGELGGEPLREQNAFADLAGKAGIPLIGPNCMGHINVQANLNSQLFFLKPKPGGLSIISQSGNKQIFFPSFR